eukprot:6189797-Pleurochrysis_carterae.AAC.1
MREHVCSFARASVRAVERESRGEQARAIASKRVKAQCAFTSAAHALLSPAPSSAASARGMQPSLAASARSRHPSAEAQWPHLPRTRTRARSEDAERTWPGAWM